MSTPFNTILGPVAAGAIVDNNAVQTFPAYALDDLNDAVAGVFTVPKTGTITHMGYVVITVTGIPPAYNCGLVTVDETTGSPTATPYSDGALVAGVDVSLGWHWIALGAGVTATVGNTIAALVTPGATPPDASNNVTLAGVSILLGIQYPFITRFSTAWTAYQGYGAMAIKYSTGEIYGLSATGFAGEGIHLNTAPDEIGNKFTLPFDATCIGLIATITYQGVNDGYSLILYNAADSIIAQVDISDEDLTLGGLGALIDLPVAAVALEADAVYRLVFKSAGTSYSIWVGGLVFSSEADLLANKTLPGAATWQKTERTDAGAWTDTPSEIMHMGIRISDITLPASGGGAYGSVS